MTDSADPQNTATCEVCNVPDVRGLCNPVLTGDRLCFYCFGVWHDDGLIDPVEVAQKSVRRRALKLLATSDGGILFVEQSTVRHDVEAKHA